MHGHCEMDCLCAHQGKHWWQPLNYSMSVAVSPGFESDKLNLQHNLFEVCGCVLWILANTASEVQYVFLQSLQLAVSYSLSSKSEKCMTHAHVHLSSMSGKAATLYINELYYDIEVQVWQTYTHVWKWLYVLFIGFGFHSSICCTVTHTLVDQGCLNHWVVHCMHGWRANCGWHLSRYAPAMHK